MALRVRLFRNFAGFDSIVKFFSFFNLRVAGIFPFIFLVVAPITFYLGNINEINIRIADVVLPVAGLVVAVSLVFYLILTGVQRHAGTTGVITGLLTGLALATWVQSQLLLWKFGSFNGQPIDWDRWRTHMILEGIGWFLLIAACIWVSLKRSRKAMGTLITGIYAAGLISMTLSHFSAPHKITVSTNDEELNELFRFHPANNVLLILLDSFQSDYFEYIADHHPDEVSAFTGFTFYRNTISRFPTTKASLPSILTGAIYKNEQPYPAYVTEAFTRFNLADAYREKGFTSSLVGFDGFFPEIISMKGAVNKLGESPVHPFYEYLDFAMFRALPTCFKPRIYNNGYWFLTFLKRSHYPPDPFGTDIRFMEFFERKAFIATKSERKGSFKLLHFTMPHPPWTVDENLRFDSTLTGAEGYIKQTRGAVNMTSRILQKLKAMQAYDCTEIVVLSDHGTMSAPQAVQLKEHEDGNPLTNFRVRTASHALLLHKPANANGAIVKSNTPLEISDLGCLLGVCQTDSLCNGYDLAMAGGNRQRTFYFYTWDDTWGSEYMPDMTEYFVTGEAYDATAYQKGSYKYTSKGRVNLISRNKYKAGTPLVFAAREGSIVFLEEGWSVPENDHCWTDGRQASIELQLDRKPVKDMTLRLWAAGFSQKGRQDRQTITVSVNGSIVTSWKMWEYKEYVAPVPLHLIQDGHVLLSFGISNPGSTPTDSRLLGMAAFKMIVE